MWWDTVVGEVNGIVVQTVFKDTSARGTPRWDTTVGPGYINDGQAFYTGEIEIYPSSGTDMRDYMQNSLMAMADNSIG